MILRSAFICAVSWLIATPAFAECLRDRVDLRGEWGTARFQVEVVDTPEERRDGLMHRRSLPKRSGMLFLFDSPGRHSFWMKNTHIPLDMLFFDQRGVLVSLHKDAEPMSTEGIDGGDSTFAVLEINAGMSELYGIDPGTEIRHPGFAHSPAWNCDGG
ncbi:MAG: DUF192 domain-containing protein [Rhodobacteraceae bacterium]|nr:DUF192 domain-containing protein [Paracoccaceae bacterium]